jgi:O-antigen ligase
MSLLRHAAGWVLLAALIFAPWAYGCTTADEIAMLNGILGTALVLWLGSLLLGVFSRHNRVSEPGHRGSMPRVLVIIASAVLVLGWAMALNARSIYDSDFFLFISRRNILPSAPGSVDAAISTAWMFRATLLIGIVFLVIDLAGDPVWLLRLWWTIALAGGSIALFGLLQKASGAQMIFWRSVPEWERVPFFATYYYHGNAGAYLNLIVPPALGLAGRALMRPRAPFAKAVSLTLALLVVAAVAANTSRMAELIGVTLILLLLVSFVRTGLRRHRMVEYKTLLLGSAVVVFTLFAIARVSHLDQPLKRWNELSSQLPADSRWLASRAALRALGDASWFGFGPGTFRVIFPYYTSGLGPGIEGTWRFLHEDYLQTLLEWGWLGTVLWGLLFFGGILVAITNLRTPGSVIKWYPRHRRLLPVIVLALIGIALHSLVDFPLQIASLQLYVAVYLGICWGSSQWEGKDAVVKRRKRKGDTEKKEIRKVKKRKRRLQQPSSRASTPKAVPNERLSTKELKMGQLRRGD